MTEKLNTEEKTEILNDLNSFETMEEKIAYVKGLVANAGPPGLKYSLSEDNDSWTVGWEFTYRGNRYGSEVIAKKADCHVIDVFQLAGDHAEASYREIRKND